MKREKTLIELVAELNKIDAEIAQKLKELKELMTNERELSYIA